eukprot:3303822-Amphidinium_carterae.1
MKHNVKDSPPPTLDRECDKFKTWTDDSVNYSKRTSCIRASTHSWRVISTFITLEARKRVTLKSILTSEWGHENLPNTQICSTHPAKKTHS